MTSLPEQPCPFVFVVGCPRSGTTLLQRMLNAHPMLAVANDTHFIPRAVDRIGLDEALTLTPEHVAFVKDYKRTRRLGLTPEAFQPPPGTTSYPGWVSQLYQAFARANGKPLAGEKTPDYVKRIGLLHRLFPQAKFVHIIRDGREVIQSVMDWSTETKGPGKLAIWSENPFAVAALWWAEQVQSGMDAGRALDGVYLEVRYDVLSKNPAPELSRIAGFLGLPDSPAMSEFHKGREIDNPKLSAKSAWRPATPGLRDRDALRPEQLQLFDVLCGDLLDRLDMPRSGGTPAPSVIAEAQRMRALWQAERTPSSRVELARDKAFGTGW